MGLVGSLIIAIVPAALSDQHGGMKAVALSEANVIALPARHVRAPAGGMVLPFSRGMAVGVGTHGIRPAPDVSALREGIPRPPPLPPMPKS
ncbi:MAG: hypothetical protein MZU97_07455 [Bacillus subtilis]|nr:hypothetical protein [Bacillus subtilis]